MTGAELVVRTIEAEDLRRIPPAVEAPPTSGADAARAAAENGNPPATENRSSSDAGDPAPLPSGGGAIVALEMALALSVQQAARRAGVPFRQVAALAKLTPDERALLEPFAPYAARYLGAAGELSPIAGLVAFGVVGVLIMSGRTADVRAMAPEKPARARAPGAPRPSTDAPFGARRAVDVEHVRTWGKVADVVDPGAQVFDSGTFPPEFQPKA